MTALLSKFRAGDRVRIDPTEGFYSYCDGWRGRVAAVGPKEPTACHSQVPEGYVVIEVERGDGPMQITIPFDQVQFDF